MNTYVKTQKSIAEMIEEQRNARKAFDTLKAKIAAEPSMIKRAKIRFWIAVVLMLTKLDKSLSK